MCERVRENGPLIQGSENREVRLRRERERVHARKDSEDGIDAAARESGRVRARLRGGTRTRHVDQRSWSKKLFVCE